jgi:hypothetical protein
MTFDELLVQHEKRLNAAFVAGVRDIVSTANVGRIEAALRAGDVEEAVRLLEISAGAWAAYQAAVVTNYQEGGAFALGEIGPLKDRQGQRFVVRFGLRNRRAEDWLRVNSSDRVTNIADEARKVVRQTLDEGMQAGRNPRAVALDIVGRVDRMAGRRIGGTVGLSEPFANAVQRARVELQEKDWAGYFSREKRDRRFDPVIRAAMRDGRGIRADQIDTITGRYADRLLKLRGDTIARTEALSALSASQDEAVKQIIDTGRVDASAVIREWDASMDARTREAHVEADGQQRRIGELFTVGGRQMSRPHDPAGGAENVINCRCRLKIKIDFLAGVT